MRPGVTFCQHFMLLLPGLLYKIIHWGGVAPLLFYSMLKKIQRQSGERSAAAVLCDLCVKEGFRLSPCQYYGDGAEEWDFICGIHSIQTTLSNLKYCDTAKICLYLHNWQSLRISGWMVGTNNRNRVCALFSRCCLGDYNSQKIFLCLNIDIIVKSEKIF